MRCLECPKRDYGSTGRSTGLSGKIIRRKRATPCDCTCRRRSVTRTSWRKKKKIELLHRPLQRYRYPHAETTKRRPREAPRLSVSALLFGIHFYDQVGKLRAAGNFQLMRHFGRNVHDIAGGKL